MKKRALGLVALAVCAAVATCKRTEKPAWNIGDASAPKSSGSAFPDEEAEAKPPPLDIGPAASSSSVHDRQEAVMALLTGHVEVARLREVSTEPDEKLDPLMREALAPRKKESRLKFLAISAEGIKPEAVQRVAQQHIARLRYCYERGLGNNPNLEGRVSVRFQLADDGTVKSVDNGGTDLPDSGVVECMLRTYKRMQFPKPDAPNAHGVVPILCAPGE